MNGVTEASCETAAKAELELRIWLFVVPICECLSESLPHKPGTATAHANGYRANATQISWRCTWAIRRPRLPSASNTKKSF